MCGSNRGGGGVDPRYGIGKGECGGAVCEDSAVGGGGHAYVLSGGKTDQQEKQQCGKDGQARIADGEAVASVVWTFQNDSFGVVSDFYIVRCV